MGGQMAVTVVGHSPGLAAPRAGGGAPAAGEQHGPLLVVHLRVEVLRVFTHRLQPGAVVELVKLCTGWLVSESTQAATAKGCRRAYIIGDPVEGCGDLAVGLAGLVVPRRVVDRVPLFVVVFPRGSNRAQSAPNTPGWAREQV